MIFFHRFAREEKEKGREREGEGGREGERERSLCCDEITEMHCIALHCIALHSRI